MTEQVYILFCESSIQKNKVDEDFEDQYISAKEIGFQTILFNYDDLYEFYKQLKNCCS